MTKVSLRIQPNGSSMAQRSILQLQDTIINVDIIHVSDNECCEHKMSCDYKPFVITHEGEWSEIPNMNYITYLPEYGKIVYHRVIFNVIPLNADSIVKAYRANRIIGIVSKFSKL